MELAWTPRRQGDLGEVSAIQWLVSAGACVFVPLVSSPDCDLIAQWGDRFERVQVKTSTFRERGRWCVRLSTSGGNQSWNRIVKRLDSARCDCLFVHVGDGRRWFIPAAALGGSTQIVLGGPKYAEFEVEPGEPLQGRSPPPAEVAE